MYLTEKTIYLLLIIFLIIIYIKNRNCKYGYANIETFEVECNEDKTNINKDFIKKEEDEEYIRIIKCDTKKLKKRLNNLHQYYIYKLLETIFLKKTEINILSLLVKNEKKCSNNCLLQTKRSIALLKNQVGNLEKIINDFELEDKNNFIEKQLVCISKINAKAQEECLNIIQSNYNDDKRSDDDIRKECIEKYTIDEELCKKSAEEISFVMTKNKCVESHKRNEKECVEIPEEIEFMTQPNTYKYIKDIEEQIKQQEPKLNRFLCYKCIKRIKDKKDVLNINEKEECKKVCKDIVEDIQEKKKEDYEKQKKLFLAQQQQMNEYYEKQYKQSDGVTSKTLQKIFNGEDAVSNSDNRDNDINDIYKHIDIEKHTISEVRFNELYNKVNSKLNQHVKLKRDDFNDMYILFNNNYTNKYQTYLSQMLIILKKKNILNILKNNIKTINEEEKEYETASNENRDILSHSGYDKQLLSTTTDKKHFTIPNLPEFYDLSKVQKDLTVNYRDLQGSPLPMTNNIYDSKFQSISIN
jgi:hypothetical protein